MSLGLNYTHVLIDLNGDFVSWIVNGTHVVNEPFRAFDEGLDWGDGSYGGATNSDGNRLWWPMGVMHVWYTGDYDVYRLKDHAIRR